MIDDSAKADAQTASILLSHWGFEVTPNQIQKWASKGFIRKLGPERIGKSRSRMMYSMADIYARATQTCMRA